MFDFSKEDDANSAFVVGRRSSRLSMIVPITVKGRSADGKEFRENTWTIVVNKHGAKLATFHSVAPGDHVWIENPILGQVAEARVIRVGEKRFPEDPYEIGVELLKAQNLWGVKFPPEDWVKGEPGVPTAEAAAAAEPQQDLTEFNMAVAALSRLAQERGRAAEPLSGQVPEPPGTRPELTGQAAIADLSAALRHVDEKLASIHSLLRQLDSQAESLRASRAEIEKLLTEAQGLQQSWKAEIQRAEHDVREAGWRALRPVLEELNEKLRQEAKAAAAPAGEETRSRLFAEAASIVESLTKEAQARLAGLVEEEIAQVSSRAVQAVTSPALEQLTRDTDRIIESATGRFSQELARLSAEAMVPLRGAIEQKLREAEGEACAEFVRSFIERVQAVSRTEENSIKQCLQGARQQLQEVVPDSVAKVRQAVEEGARAVESLERRAEAAAAKLQSAQQQAEITFSELAKVHRQQLAELSSASLDGFERRLRDLLADSRFDLEKTAQEFRERVRKEESARLEKITDELMEVAAGQMQRQVSDTSVMLTEELQASARALTEETKRELAAINRMAAETLRQESAEIAEERRAQLANMFEALQNQAEQDLTARLQSVGRKGFEVLLTEFQAGAGEVTAQAIAHLKGELAQARQEAADAVYKQVGMGAVVLKEFVDQAGERLETGAKASATTLQQQIEELTQTALGRLRQESDRLLKNLQVRFARAAGALLDPGFESDPAQS
jgi:hypothetical protein